MDTQSDVPDVGKLVIDELQRHAETVASVSRDFLKSERHRMLEVEKKLETLATEHRNRLSLLANAPTDDSTPPVSSDAELAQSASDEVGGSVPLAGHIPHPPDADGARRRKSTLTFQLPPEERYKQGERSFSSFLAFDSLISASRKGGARNEIHSVVPVSRDTYERHRRPYEHRVREFGTIWGGVPDRGRASGRASWRPSFALLREHMTHTRERKSSAIQRRLSQSSMFEFDTSEEPNAEKDFWDQNSQRVKEAYDGYMKFLGKNRHSGGFGGRHLQKAKQTRFFHTPFMRCAWAEFMMSSRIFGLLVVALIIVDAVYVAHVTDQTIRSAVRVHDAGTGENFTKSFWMILIDSLMNTVFLLEILARMMALQQQFFFGEGWKWNLFDFSMVVVSTIELAYLYASGNSFKYAAALRLLRVVRSLRLLRLLQFLPMMEDLQLMVLAFYSSSFALIAAMILLLGVILMFAIIFDNAVASYIEDSPADYGQIDSLKTFFGSLSITLLTLFMAMSGGIDWWDVVKLLLEINVAYCLIFVVFVCLTVIAALNIITGVFVNEGLAMARMDHDLRYQADLRESRAMAARLHNLFQTIVKHSHQSISMEEMKRALQREDVSTLFSVLGIEITDAAAFFDLLDQDHSGFVEIDEFVVVCLRLRGRSGMINMEISIQEISGHTKKIVSLMRSSLEAVERVERRLTKLYKLHQTTPMTQLAQETESGASDVNSELSCFD